jgi:hypothetical protein
MTRHEFMYTSMLVVATVVAGLVFVACDTGIADSPDSSSVAVTGVSLDKTKLELAIGGTGQLAATVAPSDATNKGIAWASSDSKVATVSSGGLVTAVAAGSANVTATTADGAKTASCSVIVALAGSPSASTDDKSEGSDSSPVDLALDVDHVFTIGAAGGDHSTSCYSFTASSTGAYAFDFPYFSSTYFTITIYSDRFSTIAYQNYGAYHGCTYAFLVGGLKYYMKIASNLGSASSFIGKLWSPAAIAAYTVESQGSQAAPVALSVGSNRSIRIGSKVLDQVNYYRFTSGTYAAYRLVIGASSLGSNDYAYLSLYTNSAFTTRYGPSTKLSSDGSYSIAIAPNTEYYLMLVNDSASAQSFTLSVEGYAPTYIELPIADSWKGGSLAAGEGAWYKANVTPGGQYAINVDSLYEGSGAYSAYSYFSAYKAACSASYFVGATYGYSASNTRIVTVPSDESELYIWVRGAGTYAVKLSAVPDSGSIGIVVK